MDGLAPAVQIIPDDMPIRVVGSEGRVGIPWPIVTDTFVMSADKARVLARQLWDAAARSEMACDEPHFVEVRP